MYCNMSTSHTREDIVYLLLPFLYQYVGGLKAFLVSGFMAFKWHFGW